MAGRAGVGAGCWWVPPGCFKDSPGAACGELETDMRLQAFGPLWTPNAPSFRSLERNALCEGTV